MRLIDAHKLWDVMNKATLNHIVTNTLWNTLKSVIENAPTIDAVEIVRCKDCKYFELDHFDRINGIPLITAHEVCTKWSGGSKTSKDGFCFMGERRNNDNDRDTAEA